MAAVSCREPEPTHTGVVRLDLGAAVPTRLPRPPADRSEARLFPDRPHLTQPAIALRPGEPREASVRAGSGAVLRFSVGRQDAPPGATLELEVAVNGRTAHRETIPEGKAGWQPVVVPLHAAGSVRVGFRGTFTGEEPAAPPAAARILVGSPRVTPAVAGEGRVVVWVSQDTLRADHLGAYGYGRATSPAFDRRAAEWAVFDDAVATSSWTLPSLASQFTSRYPSFHGAVVETATRDPRHTTVFEALAAAGFTVVGVSANRFVSPEFVTASGFDALWFTPGDAAEVTRLATRLADDWAGGDLALFVHYMDPHYPYTPPPPYDRLFDPGYRGRVTGKSFQSLRRGSAPAADLAHVEALYDGEIAFADAQIDTLLEALDERGLLARALLVYSADHGEEFQEHGAWTHSQTLYEEVLRVPLALRVPGLAPRRISDPVSLVDLGPTLLDALGIARPASFQGRSLLPLLRGGGLPAQAVYAETEHTHKRLNHKVAVREGRLKQILVVPRGRDARPDVLQEETFDLAADARETRPLGGPPDRERLRRYALAFLSRARTEGSVTPSAELGPDAEEGLRALGYIQ